MHRIAVELHFKRGISWNFCGFSKPFWNITTKDEHGTGATDTDGATISEFPADLPDPEVGDLPEPAETIHDICNGNIYLTCSVDIVKKIYTNKNNYCI